MRATDHDDWDAHWDENQSSSQINPAQLYRQQLLLRLLDTTEHGARFADIGSGTGEFLALLGRRVPESALLGLEYSRAGVTASKAKLAGANFIQIDLTRPVDSYDGFARWATQAVCSEVLEHIDDPAPLLAHAAFFLAPGARLVVTVPGGPVSAYDRHIGHRRHFTPQDLTRLLQEAGFEVEFATGAGFPFFNLYRLLVIARGKRLILDAKGRPGLLLQAAAGIFRGLMRLNLTWFGPGWQTIARARKPPNREA